LVINPALSEALKVAAAFPSARFLQSDLSKAPERAGHPAEHGIEFNVVVATRVHADAESKAVSPVRRGISGRKRSAKIPEADRVAMLYFDMLYFAQVLCQNPTRCALIEP
jgi:hypothetical protein